MACYSFPVAKGINENGIAAIKPAARQLIKDALLRLNIAEDVRGRIMASVEHDTALVHVYDTAEVAFVPYETFDNVKRLRIESGPKAGKFIRPDYSDSKPGWLNDETVKDNRLVIWYWPQTDHVLILEAALALAFFKCVADSFPRNYNVTPAGGATSYDRGSKGYAFNWEAAEQTLETVHDVRDVKTVANLANITEFILVPIGEIRALPGLVIAEN